MSTLENSEPAHKTIFMREKSLYMELYFIWISAECSVQKGCDTNGFLNERYLVWKIKVGKSMTFTHRSTLLFLLGFLPYPVIFTHKLFNARA
jgi:hypothetical protein